MALDNDLADERIGHGNDVCCVVFVGDESRLVSGAGDGVICLWDLESGKCLATLNGHVGIVYSLCLIGERQLASCGSDSTVRIWDLGAMRCMRTLNGHEGTVYSVCSSSSDRVISGGMDRSVRVWNTINGLCETELGGPMSAVCSICCSSSTGLIASGCCDGSILAWQGARRLTLIGHGGAVWSVKISLSGARLVSGSGDTTVRVWDCLDGACLATYYGHSGAVLSVNFDGNGTLVVSAGEDSAVRVWDTVSGECWRNLRGHLRTVWSAVINRSSTRIVSCSEDRTLRVWDPASAKCIAVLNSFRPARMFSTSSDGSFVAFGSEESVTVYEALHWRPILTVPLRAEDLQLSPDGRLLTLLDSSGSTHIWSCESGKPLVSQGCLSLIEELPPELVIAVHEFLAMPKVYTFVTELDAMLQEKKLENNLEAHNLLADFAKLAAPESTLVVQEQLEKQAKESSEAMDFERNIVRIYELELGKVTEHLHRLVTLRRRAKRLPIAPLLDSWQVAQKELNRRQEQLKFLETQVEAAKARSSSSFAGGALKQLAAFRTICDESETCVLGLQGILQALVATEERHREVRRLGIQAQQEWEEYGKALLEEARLRFRELLPALVTAHVDSTAAVEDAKVSRDCESFHEGELERSLARTHSQVRDGDEAQEAIASAIAVVETVLATESSDFSTGSPLPRSADASPLRRVPSYAVCLDAQRAPATFMIEIPIHFARLMEQHRTVDIDCVLECLSEYAREVQLDASVPALLHRRYGLLYAAGYGPSAGLSLAVVWLYRLDTWVQLELNTPAREDGLIELIALDPLVRALFRAARCAPELSLAMHSSSRTLSVCIPLTLEQLACYTPGHEFVWAEFKLASLSGPVNSIDSVLFSIELAPDMEHSIIFLGQLTAVGFDFDVVDAVLLPPFILYRVIEWRWDDQDRTEVVLRAKSLMMFET
eukprot:NODE_125_length_3172_cov_24.896254_g115_i0.p1 GENE.NODE_125_length_3172_cov_24.896254_g115_i0~~NODE_125_length_3172_cov_24.896254_g115_i0.p1  ORF type:complete len:944 (+),score=163.69 NODE_125_length_3172_cov_24.896254_g115_i0:136-2967(+)